MQGLVVAYEDRSVRIASQNGTLVGVWRDPPNGKRAAGMRSLLRQMLAQQPGVLTLHVIVPGSSSPLTLPDGDRKELTETMRLFKGTQSTAAIAVEGIASKANSTSTNISFFILFPPYHIGGQSPIHERLSFLSVM